MPFKYKFFVFISILHFTTIAFSSDLTTQSKTCTLPDGSNPVTTLPKDTGTPPPLRVWTRTMSASGKDGYTNKPIPAAYYNYALTNEIKKKILGCFDRRLDEAHWHVTSFDSSLDNLRSYFKAGNLNKTEVIEIVAMKQAFLIYESSDERLDDRPWMATQFIKTYLELDTIDCVSMSYTAYDFLRWLQYYVKIDYFYVIEYQDQQPANEDYNPHLNPCDALQVSSPEIFTIVI